MERNKPYWIIEGDQVTVKFGGGRDSINGVVRARPESSGDCWIIESEHEIFYVRQYELIVRAKPEADQPGGEG